MKFEQMPQINDTEQEVKEVKKIKKAGIWLGLAAALTPATSIAQTATEVNQENVSGTENKKLESPQTLAESEGKEKEILGERFFGQTRLYRVIYGDLNEKQIQFFNDHGVPLGAPTELVPIIERNGESTTIISPGVIDKDGFLIGKINKGWLDKKRQEVCLAYQNVKCDLSVDLPAQTNSIRLLREARFESLKLGEPIKETLADYVWAQSQKKVQEKGIEINYFDYITSKFGENVELPDTIEDELKMLLVGLAAQESQYNIHAKSPVGAKGLLQFMPETWESFGYNQNETSSTSKQVLAAGKLFLEQYNYFERNKKFELDYIKKNYFQGDEESFERYFYVPLMINSFNSGQGRMGKVMSWFIEKYPTLESIKRGSELSGNPQKYDVFASMAELARNNNTDETKGYKKDSSEYVLRVFAFAMELHERNIEK